MMRAQLDRHKVTNHAIPASTEAASRLLSSVSARTGATDAHDQAQYRLISGSTAGCAGLWSPDGERLEPMADRSAKEPGTQSNMGNPWREVPGYALGRTGRARERDGG